jgi:hypothetical protein
MATTYLTPNMSLVVPVVLKEPGPSWASDVNSSLIILDAHTHSAGSGVQITPTGININSDLAFNGNNAIALRSARFNIQTTPLSLATDLACLYSSPTATGDLYYNDGLGNQIRITQSGAVTGASGTITGLPSGTASASYSSGSGTFVFQQATATAANLDIGSVIIRYPGSYPTPAGNAIILEAPSSLASLYSIILPALPTVSTGIVTLNTSGNLAATLQPDNSTIVISGNQLTVGLITGSNITPGSINAAASIAAGSITGNLIASQTINASASIAPGSIVGSLIAPSTSITIVGLTATSSVTINTKQAVVGNTAVSYSLGIIRGIVNASGGITGGEGFSVSSNGSGTYTITFITGFADIPAITTNSNQGNVRIGDILSASTTSAQIFFPAITPFSFIAIGQRS